MKPSSIDLDGKPFHFIGIGGIGMSALAYVLAKRHIPVSGSDARLNHITQRLSDVGVHVFSGQAAENLDGFGLNHGIPISQPELPEVVGMVSGGSTMTLEKKPAPFSTQATFSSISTPQVICSTAINHTNPEYQAAQEMGYPIYHRSDVLAALTQRYQSIAVAGTHGKTTTSSMIGYMLLRAGLDPTIVVGGEVETWQGNARVGDSHYLVAEADESDGSLAKLSAHIGIVTNIELDHPDHYSSLDDVVSVFKTFARQCKFLVGSIDCPTVRDQLRPGVTYSLDRDSEADYTVDEVTYYGDHTEAQVWERGKSLGRLTLRLLGQHNLSNALSAIAVGRLLNLDFETISLALASFSGARRRFEYRGSAAGITFVDDYAHHPSEIKVTLAAARLAAHQTVDNEPVPSRVVAVFQPHRYTRTQTFLDEFATSFSDADLVFITDIYSAGEAVPEDGLSGRDVANAIAKHHHHVHYVPSILSLPDALPNQLQPGDLVMFLGAGNVNQAIPELLAVYQHSQVPSILS